MYILFSKRFKKRHSRLDLVVQNKFRQRLLLLLEDKDNVVLNIHPLKGKFKGFYSFNVTGDVRVIFKIITENDVIFILAIGSHSELYE